MTDPAKMLVNSVNTYACKKATSNSSNVIKSSSPIAGKRAPAPAAETIKRELDEKLAQISDEAAKRLAEAVKLGEAQKEQILSAAKEQSERLIEQAKTQIEAEKNKALSDVRGEIARTAVLAASKVVQQQMNEESAKSVVARVLEEIKEK